MCMLVCCTRNRGEKPGCDVYTNDRLSDSKRLKAQNPESKVRDGVLDNSGIDIDILRRLGIESP